MTGSGPDHRARCDLLCTGTLTVSSVLVTVLAQVVRRDPVVRATGRAVDPLRALTTTLAFVAALLLVLLWPGAGYWPLLLLVVDGPVHRAVRSRRPLPG